MLSVALPCCPFPRVPRRPHSDGDVLSDGEALSDGEQLPPRHKRYLRAVQQTVERTLQELGNLELEGIGADKTGRGGKKGRGEHKHRSGLHPAHLSRRVCGAGETLRSQIQKQQQGLVRGTSLPLSPTPCPLLHP